MFKKYEEVKTQLITESLVTLANVVDNKKKFKVEILNNDAINSTDTLNYLVVRVIKGNVKKLAEEITAIYNYSADINGDKILFKMN